LAAAPVSDVAPDRMVAAASRMAATMFW
jgi:hypothetical protein